MYVYSYACALFQYTHYRYCDLLYMYLCLSLQTVEFWKMLVQVVQALLMLGSWEAIRGLGVWVKILRGQTPPWIVAAEAQAKSR